MYINSIVWLFINICIFLTEQCPSFQAVYPCKCQNVSQNCNNYYLINGFISKNYNNYHLINDLFRMNFVVQQI